MYSEDDLLPISALQHLVFCPRQCALIHIEGLWEENRLTAEGRLMHERVHDPSAGRGGAGVRVATGLQVRSLTLGLYGVADVVEFHPAPEPGRVAVAFPVEYKRGRPKRDDSDRVQLCAQAMCLEEMTGAQVPAGALFYGQPRRRQDVCFDAGLRSATVSAAAELHRMIEAGKTPAARFEKKCKNCSLLDRCLPGAANRSVSNWLDRVLRDTADP